jgi:hypothetical protein
MPKLKLPGLIAFLKRHYEELVGVFDDLRNNDLIDRVSKMMVRVAALIQTLEDYEMKTECKIE